MPSIAVRWSVVPSFVLAMLSGPFLHAQCNLEWQAASALCGTNNDVLAATSWDPDGAGPLPPRVVVAGGFGFAGRAQANGVASFDPTNQSWSALDGGLAAGELVRALATSPNGDLVAVGNGNGGAERVLRWNGAAWSVLGTVTGSLDCVAILPNGDVVAGGAFSAVDSQPIANLARWDGSSWAPIGSLASTRVHALCVASNGDLLAAAVTSGVVTDLTRWNGATWTTFGTANSWVNAIVEQANGDVIAGGYFLSIDGVNTSPIARWNGTSWSGLGSGIVTLYGAIVDGIVAHPDGSLYISGAFVMVGGVQAIGIARWNGTSWSSLGSGIDQRGLALTLAPDGNGLVLGGNFTRAGGLRVERVAAWNGIGWSRLGAEVHDRVVDFASTPGGDLIAFGSFVEPGTPTFAAIGQWNGSSWSFAGGGCNGRIESGIRLSDGDLVVGGHFTLAGGVAASRIARWNGTNWAPLGSGLDGPVYRLLELANGDLLVGGMFATAGGTPANAIARWNGTTWSGLGTTGWTRVEALAELPTGDLVAGGYLPQGVQRWDGTGWAPLGGSGVGGGASESVLDMMLLPNGDLVVGGSFGWANGPANRIARWNGSAWSPFGGGFGTNFGNSVQSLGLTPNGEVLAGYGGTPNGRVARWNGSTWSDVASGIDGTVHAFGRFADGAVASGGEFRTVGGLPSSYVARLATTCPATAGDAGPGCPSSGGANLLAAATLPWLGSTFRAVGTGLPALANVYVVLGLTPAAGGLDLSNVFPAASAGCVLHVNPDVVVGLGMVAGSVEVGVPLPNTPSLAGAAFHQQLVVAETGIGGYVTAVTVTNALDLVAGFF